MAANPGNEVVTNQGVIKNNQASILKNQQGIHF